MGKVATADQRLYERALACGLILGNYTKFTAKLTAEQHGLRWHKVKILAGV